MVACGWLLPHGSEFPQAPDNVHTIGLGECGDKNKDMDTGNGAPMTAALNELYANPRIQFEMEIEEGGFKKTIVVTCVFNVSVGGDQAMMAAMNCVADCKHCARHVIVDCVFLVLLHTLLFRCEVNAPDMCETNQKKLDNIPERTRDKTELGAHRRLGGVCPYCKRTIVKKADYKKKNSETQVPQAEPGDPEPAVPDWVSVCVCVCV